MASTRRPSGIRSSPKPPSWPSPLSENAAHRVLGVGTRCPGDGRSPRGRGAGCAEAGGAEQPMTRPNRRDADRLLLRWTLGGLGIVVRIVGVLVFTGCSLAIARGGVSDLSEVPEEGVSRKEIHDMLGQPVSSTVCVDGRRIDTHPIR